MLTLRSFAALLSQVGDAKVVETPEESTAISPKGRCNNFVPFFSYKSFSALNLKALAHGLRERQGNQAKRGEGLEARIG